MIKSAIAAYWSHVMSCRTPQGMWSTSVQIAMSHDVLRGLSPLWDYQKLLITFHIFMDLSRVTCRLEITLVSRVWISPVRVPKLHPSYLVRSTWGFLMPYKSPTASCKTLPHTYPNLLCASRYNIHEFQPTATCLTYPSWEGYVSLVHMPNLMCQ